jgi:hypothetical protein
MFQVFHLDVAKVDLRCCICCNNNIRMLQTYVSVVSDVCFKCFIGILQKYIWMLHNMHVSRACFQCFIYMLQVFHLDVVKVDLDVAYVVMAIYACFKRMFQVFQLFLVVCYKCFN